jgi:hypothetical protein
MAHLPVTGDRTATTLTGPLRRGMASGHSQSCRQCRPNATRPRWLKGCATDGIIGIGIHEVECSNTTKFTEFGMIARPRQSESMVNSNLVYAPALGQTHQYDANRSDIGQDRRAVHQIRHPAKSRRLHDRRPPQLEPDRTAAPHSGPIASNCSTGRTPKVVGRSSATWDA